MIAAHLSGAGRAASDRFRLQATLGSHPRRSALAVASPGLALACWAGASGEPALAEREGLHVLFDGWIANREDLCAALTLPVDTADAFVYTTALDHWGDGADSRIDGHYAAIAARDGQPALRLARSPFVAPPLHFAAAGGQLVASSLPRSLAILPGPGLGPLDLDLQRAVLAGDLRHAGKGWYRGTARAPLGTVLRVEADGTSREVWRYALGSGQTGRDRAVDHARALLDSAVRAASRGCRKPSVSLSGGLDSSLVAESLLRVQPSVVHGYCYAPEPGVPLVQERGLVADESAIATAFAQFHGQRIQLTILRNEGADFRRNLDRLLSVARCAPREMGLVFELDGAMAAAAGAGCDVMLGGDEGNSTFSATGSWAYRDLFLRGRWVRLLRELRLRRDDPRGLVRRFAGLVLDDWLPGRGPRRRVPAAHFAALGLAPAGVERAGLAGSPALAFLRRRHSRSPTPAELAAFLLTEDDGGRSDALKALEVMHGIPYRDPTVTRAMVEFCLSLPSGEFLCDGETRHLARRMAVGRMPEAQRLARDSGATGADRHARILRVRGELRDELDRFAGDAEIAAMLDLAHIAQRLDALGPEPDASALEQLFVCQGLPAAIAAGRMIARAKGRNDV